MPPRHGCIPAGRVREAKFAEFPPQFIKPVKQTGVKRTGVLYEKKAQLYIEREIARHGKVAAIEIMFSPWITFASESDRPGAVRYCQPDCLLLEHENFKITIIETKLQHCREAYNQIRLLYEPVVRFMFPDYEVAALELVQWHDPHINFPEKYYYEPTLTNAEAGKFAVHIWNPRYDPVRKVKK